MDKNTSSEYTQDTYSATYAFRLPEWSEWRCYMFGNTPSNNCGIVWRPRKGQEPNAFVRWMMKLCFACTWVKEK